MRDGRERRTMVHSPTAGNPLGIFIQTGFFPMQICPYYDQAFAEEAGHLSNLFQDQLKRLCFRQMDIKTVNQYQIVNLVPVPDEGIETIYSARKEKRYTVFRNNDITG